MAVIRVQFCIHNLQCVSISLDALSSNILHLFLRGKKRKVKHPKIQLIDLFCICRLPETAGDQMVQCYLYKNWLHTKCVNVPQICLQQSKQEWCCDFCQL